ncbi:L-lactate dehydrogenase complex protein LldF [Granulicella pectinivorans]|jgi:L-lactate dehydrogenase complex protein LldF|uniref:L-lactate dehydrogenase complex protein LldF n=1 Tax=Granulicella pectinivorans TaxID=474950 RepID=A0A1I6M2S1_9BACT|nr:LutB/LldF family L-lactate oxidation iron-sulfur protein [Granulicella pectinivorans]SFS09964.1 L-lactate dehydrogenase complex protein LldF [Granulicella pectinivorans]
MSDLVTIGHKPLDPRTALSFPKAARALVGDTQMRKNVRHATNVIQGKRAKVVEEMPDWQALREAGRRLREHTMANLDVYLERFETNCTAAGGTVHWAKDAEEARRIIVGLVKASGSDEVIKIKSMTTEEIQLNKALSDAGIKPYETDLAELIIQLGHDQPSHIVVPALHKNRQQIREIFKREMNLPNLGDTPQDLADAARLFLREKFLKVKTGVSGANFLIAETGGVCVVESEGNGRMCLTLPETLITVAGIDKVVPRLQDLEVLLQVLPRSATGERMNPYNSIWTGVDPHEADGPKAFHVVLMDNARTKVLADGEGRQTLNCIRCGACQNACPVYKQTGGHAYGSVYAGPIGAILTPQLMNMEHAQTLPYASSLCGACYEVCPVKINIPEILVHLRSRVVEEAGLTAESVAMKTMAMIFRSEKRFRAAQRLGRLAEGPLVSKDGNGEGWIGWLPGLLGGWTQVRDLQSMPKETFRDWWEARGK